MIDMTKTTIPKSDQLNADDLSGGVTKTIKVRKVSLAAGDQPVAINYDGDNDKPYMPCKSMRRVLVNVWGSDGTVYVGRSMTLYRDDKVLFGGVAVGGIRISHMSHIDKDITMALTATRANRKPFTVKPLVDAKKHDAATQALIDEATSFAKEIEIADTSEKLSAIEERALTLNNKLIEAKLLKIKERILTLIEEQKLKQKKP